jgi:hypothetical protein
MRNPAQHLDENTVLDLLARSVPAEDTHAVAIHLVTCRPCREMVQSCRALADPDGPGSRERRLRGQVD